MKTHKIKQTPKQIHVSALDTKKYIAFEFEPGSEVTVITPTHENYAKGKGYIIMDIDLKNEDTSGTDDESEYPL